MNFKHDINYQEAKSLVEQEIDKNQNSHSKIECVILEEETIEKEWGWVFFYQSKQYVETGDFRCMLGGNAPYLVNRHSGILTVTGTTHDIDFYLNEYEKIL